MSVSTRPRYTNVTRTPLPASSAPSASANAPQGELARDLVAIPVIDVLTHGLRHLAMLRISDHRIAASLSGSWHELLAAGNRCRAVCSNTTYTSTPHRLDR